MSPALCAAADVPASRTADAERFIALLLPLNAPEFAPAAEAVLLGCQAALKFAERAPVLQVLRTDAGAGSILAEYAGAVQRGAAVVVGPMTRSGVAALAASKSVSVATLALNVAEGGAPLPPRLYSFSLSLESEARLVARTAFAEQLREVVVVQAATPLAKRAGRAFAEEWLALGGAVHETREFDPKSDLAVLKQQLAALESGLIFLAADAEQSRRVRPYLNNQIPVYATSLVHDGSGPALSNGDLNGIRFVEMPWLIEPDHPAVMVYPRAESIAGELQRFYALGIDACRIAGQLLRGRTGIVLDGVTGRLSLRGDNSVEREPVQAVFRDGAGVAIGARR